MVPKQIALVFLLAVILVATNAAPVTPRNDAVSSVTRASVVNYKFSKVGSNVKKVGRGAIIAIVAVVAVVALLLLCCICCCCCSCFK